VVFSWIGIVIAVLSILCAVVSLVAARHTWRKPAREEEIARALEAYERVKEVDRRSNRTVASARGRVRAAEVRLFLAENEPLLENEDLDRLVSGNLLLRSISLLNEMSKEILAINEDEQYPLEDFQELMVAFKRIDQFSKDALAFHERKFGHSKEAEARRREAEEKVVQLHSERAV